MIVGDDLFSRPVIVVWFSCGAASAVAAKKTIEMFGNHCDIRIVNNPVKEEDSDNRRFLNDVSEWINHPIEISTNYLYPNCSAVEIWDERNYMSGNEGAPCTGKLKREARQQWETRNRDVTNMVFGFTADEEKRHKNFILTERSNVLPVLIHNRLTKDDCFRIVTNAARLIEPNRHAP